MKKVCKGQGQGQLIRTDKDSSRSGQVQVKVESRSPYGALDLAMTWTDGALVADVGLGLCILDDICEHMWIDTQHEIPT